MFPLMGDVGAYVPSQCDCEPMNLLAFICGFAAAAVLFLIIHHLLRR